MNNKKYEAASIEIYSLEGNDIIVTSFSEPELDWNEGDDFGG